MEERLWEQKKLEHRKEFKSALKALILGPLVFVVGVVVIALAYHCTGRILPEYDPFDSVYQIIHYYLVRVIIVGTLPFLGFVYFMYGVVGTTVGLVRLVSEPLHRRQPTTLHDAAIAGNLKRVKNLLKSGVPLDAVDFKGRTALHSAALQGHGSIVEFLLAQGADANAVDRDGQTGLSLAEQGNDHAGIVHLLRQHGAKDAQSEGARSLDKA